MRILVMKQKDHPKFMYDLFMAQTRTLYDTTPNTVEESCACEIVMARYIYAIFFIGEASKYVQPVAEAILADKAADTQVIDFAL